MIFIVSADPFKAAKVLDDKTLELTIEKTVEILRNAVSGNSDDLLVSWTKKTNSNYWWVFQYYNGLNREYYLRNKKSHKSMRYVTDLRDGVEIIQSGPTTEFVNATKVRKYENVHEAYKKALLNKWKKEKPKWSNSSPPEWYKN